MVAPKAIRAAFEKPRQVDSQLVDAQQARRVLDRIVGYKISPLLWDKVRRGLSAGRVQTVALRLIVEREQAIRAFVTSGWQGVNYAKGVWHHPLIALGEVSDFIVVDRGGEGCNLNEQDLAESLWLTDDALSVVNY